MFVLSFFLAFASASLHLSSSYPTEEIKKTHQWVVKIDGGEKAARLLSSEMGLVFKGKVGTLNYYIIEGKWPLSNRVSPFTHPIQKREASHRKRNWASTITETLQQHPGVRFSEEERLMVRVKRKFTPFNDPFWDRSWHINGGARGGHDMNVRDVWNLGYSGRGVVVTTVDDGLETDHPEIAPNYDPEASTDINDADRDPTPHYSQKSSNRHGTRCAGQIAAVANNSRCTVGIAFGASVGGVRMLDGPVTDAVEAAALSFNPQHIDIYSASWGPRDDGKTLEGPGRLTKAAFQRGATRGRGGRGNIFVWASGNGGLRGDSCACDGYANSIYTVSVGSASEWGVKPYYMEECASTIASTYSSGSPTADRKIITTTLRHGCTDKYTGTSASASIATAMIALTLQANPRLTWRDVQHIIIRTSRPGVLRNGNFRPNGIGRQVSDTYGYGIMDGLGMVLMAQSWQNVPKQHRCWAHFDNEHRNLTSSLPYIIKYATVTFNATCFHIDVLEHVELRISMQHQRRGDISIYLISPAGTRSRILAPRRLDTASGVFNNWPFVSLHFWGESPYGNWRLEIINTGSRANVGVFKMWRLLFYGTKLSPSSNVPMAEEVYQTRPPKRYELRG